jgi:hypothetical protein
MDRIKPSVEVPCFSLGDLVKVKRTRRLHMVSRVVGLGRGNIEFSYEFTDTRATGYWHHELESESSEGPITVRPG